MLSPSSELLRIDPLTGCKNFLGFLETCLDVSSDSPSLDLTMKIIETSPTTPSQYSAILFVEMNNLGVLNESKGHAYGDSALHWMGILLGEESNQTVYRLGGDEFAVWLPMETREKHAQFLECILERMGPESKQLGFPGFPADVALILCDQSPTTLDTILMQMGEAMVRVKNSEKSHAMIFLASDFKVPAQIPYGWRSTGDSNVSFTVRWLSYKSIFQVLEMGRSLDKVQQDAYTDAISNLPNMKAALLNLEQVLQNAIANHKCFSLLMIDGDNIRAYNSINYAAGDQMIRDMSAVFKNNLRPNDFVARWRSGDEFLVILPDTTSEAAKTIGERFRLAVKEASQAWKFPVTISIGLASYPVHGEDASSLIDKVESANKRAKEQGKDQVVLAD